MKPSDAQVEAAARALHAQTYADDDWVKVSEMFREHYRAKARVALEAALSIPTEQSAVPDQAIWSCKIGEYPRSRLGWGSDAPMRESVARAYRLVTGYEASFIFSGWGAELTESERAAVERREGEKP